MPTITTVDAAWTPSPSTFDDAEARRFDTAMFLGDGSNNGVRGGVVRHGDNSLAVAVNGSDQVTVQAGAFVIPAATGLGVYRGALQSTTAAVALATRNATNPRIDLIAIQATSTGAVVKTIDGTPSSSPAVPSLPAQHIELARVTVPASGGGAVTVDSSWRQYASAMGGCVIANTAARLPNSGNMPGQPAITLDTGTQWAWDSTATKWRVTCNPGEWTAYGASIGSQGGALSNASANGRYSIVGRTMNVEITGAVVFAGTATGGLRLGLPSGINASTVRTTCKGGGRESQSTGVALTVTLISATTLNVLRFDNSTLLADGRTAEIYATLELAA